MYNYREYSGEDRRRFQRLKLSLSVFYSVTWPAYAKTWFGDEEVEGTTLDISEGGMALLTDRDIPASTELSVRVRFFKMDRSGTVNYYEPLEMAAEVRSNYILEKRRFRLGISFIKKDAQTQERIHDLLLQAS